MKSIKQLFLAVIITMIVMIEMSLLVIDIFGNIIIEDKIKQNMEQVDFVAVLKEEEIKQGVTTNKMEKIYEIASRVGLSTNVVDEVINSKATKELAGIYASNMSHYLFTGEERNITSHQLEQVISSSIDTMVDETGIPLSSQTKQGILTMVTNYSDEIVNIFPTTTKVATIIDEESMTMIRFLFSDQLKSLGIGIIFVLCIIFMIVDHSWLRIFFYHGIVTIIVSVLCYICYHNFTTSFLSTLLEDSVLIREVLIASLNTIQMGFMNFSKIFFMISIIHFIFYFGLMYYFKQLNLQKSVNKIDMEIE